MEAKLSVLMFSDTLLVLVRGRLKDEFFSYFKKSDERVLMLNLALHCLEKSHLISRFKIL